MTTDPNDILLPGPCHSLSRAAEMAKLLHARKLYAGRCASRRLCVYLLRDGMTDEFKVGVSNSPKRRLTELRGASGRRNLAIVRTLWLNRDEAFAAEANLLAILNGGPGLDEWVRMTPRKVFDVFDETVEEHRAKGSAPPEDLSIE